MMKKANAIRTKNLPGTRMPQIKGGYRCVKRHAKAGVRGGVGEDVSGWLSGHGFSRDGNGSAMFRS